MGLARKNMYTLLLCNEVCFFSVDPIFVPKFLILDSKPWHIFVPDPSENNWSPSHGRSLIPGLWSLIPSLWSMSPHTSLRTCVKPVPGTAWTRISGPLLMMNEIGINRKLQCVSTEWLFVRCFQRETWNWNLEMLAFGTSFIQGDCHVN